MSSTSASLTSTDLDIIRFTFSIVAADPKTTTSRFYANLFRLDPSLRALFHGDMTNQGEKLMSMLGLIVSQLERFDQLRPTIRQLGQRHATYGVKASSYATVGLALREALMQQSGPAWTAEADRAWEKAYGLLSDTMAAAVPQVPGTSR